MNKSKLGLLDENIGGEDDQDGIIEAVPKEKAEELLEIIRRGMKSANEMSLPFELILCQLLMN